MGFEEFEPRYAVSSKKRPMVTILKQGVFGVNQAAAVFLRDVEQVVFLFDKATRRIGLRPEKGEAANGYNVRRAKQGGALQISGSRFLDHYGIAHEETKRYPCEWDEKAKMLVVQL